jgi:hypothetical protein
VRSWSLAVVLGDPGYYGRFGFEAAGPHGIFYRLARSTIRISRSDCSRVLISHSAVRFGTAGRLPLSDRPAPIRGCSCRRRSLNNWLRELVVPRISPMNMAHAATFAS